jgi:cytochrome c oxidase subunit 3
MAHSATTTERAAHYHVPSPMPWPILGSTSLFLMALGAVFVFNGRMGGWVSIAAGFMLLLYMLVRWFGDVIRESEGGKYGHWEDLSFRWGMSWFIFSEVMFFGAFFGALFWMRQYSIPDLATIESNALVWPGFSAHWPSAGPGYIEEFSPMGAWGIPAINTLLLLLGWWLGILEPHGLRA